ncbi:hypothetical protein AB0J47_01830 [Nocardia sp. NPDC049737]|uniref:hypothetical protein n=1 Tax=Nocardia sp. NPDC049737 TaxID=3154358 RepID=UPI00343D3283
MSAARDFWRFEEGPRPRGPGAVNGVMADGHAHHLGGNDPLSPRLLTVAVEHDPFQVRIDTGCGGIPQAQAAER